METDYKLLKELFEIFSPSYKEAETAKFITSYLDSLSISYKIDSHGNIFNISHNAPLISAHMDTVMKEQDFALFESRPITFYDNLVTKKTECRPSKPRIIGADDKCGIYIVLKTLEENKEINFLFSTCEEVGAVGASGFVAENDLAHIPYGIVLDRGNCGDIICSKNGYGVKALEDALSVIGKSYEYYPCSGVFSDCDALNSKISCANISVGYYKAHTYQEYFVVEEMEIARIFLRDILENIKDKFDKPEPRVNVLSEFDFSSYCSISFSMDKKRLIYLDKYNKYISIDVVKEILDTLGVRVAPKKKEIIV